MRTLLDNAIANPLSLKPLAAKLGSLDPLQRASAWVGVLGELRRSELSPVELALYREQLEVVWAVALCGEEVGPSVRPVLDVRNPAAFEALLGPLSVSQRAMAWVGALGELRSVQADGLYVDQLRTLWGVNKVQEVSEPPEPPQTAPVKENNTEIERLIKLIEGYKADTDKFKQEVMAELGRDSELAGKVDLLHAQFQNLFNDNSKKFDKMEVGQGELKKELSEIKSAQGSLKGRFDREIGVVQKLAADLRVELDTVEAGSTGQPDVSKQDLQAVRAEQTAAVAKLQAELAQVRAEQADMVQFQLVSTQASQKLSSELEEVKKIKNETKDNDARAFITGLVVWINTLSHKGQYNGARLPLITQFPWPTDPRSSSYFRDGNGTTETEHVKKMKSGFEGDPKKLFDEKNVLHEQFPDDVLK